MHEMIDSSSKLWSQSPKDCWLVLVSLVEASLKVIIVLYFGSLPATALMVCAIILTLLNCMNYEVTGHYFIHRPFFKPPVLNSLFGILNSIAFGFPQTLYRAEHLNHHQFGCDYKDPVTGLTRDESSIYRHGPGGRRPEPAWAYTLVGPFRENLTGMYRRTPKRLRRQLALEALAVVALLGAAAWIHIGAFLFLLALLWSGSAASHYQSWLEHAHATPGSRLTDSVSSYGRVYNWLWFNNGYHQEHHFCPTAHWTELPALRAQMLPEDRRRVVRHAHLWNLSDR